MLLKQFDVYIRLLRPIIKHLINNVFVKIRIKLKDSAAWLVCCRVDCILYLPNGCKENETKRPIHKWRKKALADGGATQVLECHLQ